METFIDPEGLTECSGLVGRALGDRKVACSRLTGGSHCVVSLSKTLYLLLSTGSTKEDRNRPNMTETLLTQKK